MSNNKKPIAGQLDSCYLQQKNLNVFTLFDSIRFFLSDVKKIFHFFQNCLINPFPCTVQLDE
ncbi:MAG: hypothetical protein D6805_08600 [Planctomycetota bacterium]|nr:MAG: hypothetical protein D6805_08600 [Planctomycetota bacterium]